jgi:hydroxymethylpyrimidine pyrophosphatase-like HAD family hydrolase
MYEKISKNVPIVIDIDDTLIVYEHQYFWENPLDKYKKALPNKEEISLCNKLYDNGYTIILHTGRNWDKLRFTEKQMQEMGIKYHQLVMGKPQGVYIDTDSYKSLKDIEEKLC